MADLISLLSLSSNALAAHRGAAATASHNMQNVNTPGFSRQRADLATSSNPDRVGNAYIGRGAVLQTVSQARDRFLEAQLPAAFAAASRSAIHSESLQAVAALNPDAPGGLTHALSNFYATLRSTAQNPGDLGLRRAVLMSARQLANAFNNTGGQLDRARAGLDAQVAGKVDEASGLMRLVADLNEQIRSARAGGGGEPNDLLDMRQRGADRLSELTGAVPIPSANGDVSLALPSGTSLVNGVEYGKLSVAPDPANLGHVQVQVAPPGAGLARSIPPGALGGELGGVLDARDDTLATAQRSLDTLAFEFAGVVNAAHQTGFAMDGSAGLDLFDVSATSVGAATTLKLNAVVDADPRLLAAAGNPSAFSGDAGGLIGMIDSETTSLSNGASTSGGLATLIQSFGSATSGMKATAEYDLGLKQHLEGMRESVSGVSIDEELINLTRAQRAFEATSKVIQTTDEMLETLLQLK